MTPILYENLSVAFDGVRAVDGLNLEVPDGAIYGLVGPNGVGKTSVIKAMMNTFRPTSGRAEIPRCNSRLLRAGDFTRIGYVSKTRRCPTG